MQRGAANVHHTSQAIQFLHIVPHGCFCTTSATAVGDIASFCMRNSSRLVFLVGYGCSNVAWRAVGLLSGALQDFSSSNTKMSSAMVGSMAAGSGCWGLYTSSSLQRAARGHRKLSIFNCTAPGAALRSPHLTAGFAEKADKVRVRNFMERGMVHQGARALMRDGAVITTTPWGGMGWERGWILVNGTVPTQRFK